MGETREYEPNDDDKNIDEARATEPVPEAGAHLRPGDRGAACAGREQPD